MIEGTSSSPISERVSFSARPNGPNDSPSDDQLMWQVRNGNADALGVLFERHHERLYRFCTRMTGRPALAEDVVQDVFARMLRYRKTFRSDSRFEPWMFRLARNAAADHFRKHGREEPAAEPPAPVATDPSAHQRLEHDEAIDLLQRALLELPSERREVLVLSRFHSRRYAEIAEILGCSEGAVKVRVHRAIKQLRQVYGRLVETAHAEIGAEACP